VSGSTSRNGWDFMKKKTKSKPLKTAKKPVKKAGVRKPHDASLIELLASSENVRCHLFAAAQEFLAALEAAACIIKGVAKQNCLIKEYPAVPQAIQMVTGNIQQLLKKL
jgi:hypothetical protein